MRYLNKHRDSWPKTHTLSDDIEKQLFDYHTALVDCRGISPSLIELTVDHYWNLKYEQGLDGESFKYNISNVQKGLVEFMKHIFGIQLIGLNLLSITSQVT